MDDLQCFVQVVENQNMQDIIQWPLEIQCCYFKKILFVFLPSEHAKIRSVLQLICSIIKCPKILQKNEENVDHDHEEGKKTDFVLKKMYLNLIHKAFLQKPFLIESMTQHLLPTLTF